MSLENEDFRESQREGTRFRIRCLYAKAIEEIGRGIQLPVTTLLDFGTYDGSFLPILLNVADRVISFDGQKEKLEEAKAREELQNDLKVGRLSLFNMMAQAVGIAPGSVDLVTVFEMFGAGFIGTRDDVNEVFHGINRALRPGGFCALTVRSRTFDEMLGPIFPVHVIDENGVSVYKDDISLMLEEHGGRVTWFGQVIYPHEANATFPVFTYRDTDLRGHAIWDDDAFVPRPIPDLKKESPVYWLGIWQKPQPQE